MLIGTPVNRLGGLTFFVAFLAVRWLLVGRKAGGFLVKFSILKIFLKVPFSLSCLAWRLAWSILDMALVSAMRRLEAAVALMHKAAVARASRVVDGGTTSTSL